MPPFSEEQFIIFKDIIADNAEKNMCFSEHDTDLSKSERIRKWRVRIEKKVETGGVACIFS